MEKPPTRHSHLVVSLQGRQPALPIIRAVMIDKRKPSYEITRLCSEKGRSSDQSMNKSGYR